MQGGSSENVPDFDFSEQARNLFEEIKDQLEGPTPSELSGLFGGFGYPTSESLRRDVENVVYKEGGFASGDISGALAIARQFLDQNIIQKYQNADGTVKAGGWLMLILSVVAAIVGKRKYDSTDYALKRSIRSIILNPGDESAFNDAIDAYISGLRPEDKKNLKNNIDQLYYYGLRFENSQTFQIYSGRLERTEEFVDAVNDQTLRISVTAAPGKKKEQIFAKIDKDFQKQRSEPVAQATGGNYYAWLIGFLVIIVIVLVILIVVYAQKSSGFRSGKDNMPNYSYLSGW